jgi:hypothetical protein
MVLTNEDGLATALHRCFPPSFGYLAKQLQRRRYLEIDQSETRMACGGQVY